MCLREIFFRVTGRPPGAVTTSVSGGELSAAVSVSIDATTSTSYEFTSVSFDTNGKFSGGKLSTSQSITAAAGGIAATYTHLYFQYDAAATPPTYKITGGELETPVTNQIGGEDYVFTNLSFDEDGKISGGSFSVPKAVTVVSGTYAF